MPKENLPQPEKIKEAPELITTPMSQKPKDTPGVDAVPRTPGGTGENTLLVWRKKAKTLLILLTGIALAASLVFAGYQLGQNQQIKVKPSPAIISTSTPFPTSTPLPSPTPDPTANWKAYKNENYGFEFKYPNNWFLENTKVCPSKELFKTKALEGYCFSIETTSTTSEVYVKQFNRCVEGKPGTIECTTPFPILDSEISIKLDSVSATKLKISTQLGLITSQLLFRKNGKNFILSYKDDNLTHNQILSTFKFLD